MTDDSGVFGRETGPYTDILPERRSCSSFQRSLVALLVNRGYGLIENDSFTRLYSHQSSVISHLVKHLSSVIYPRHIVNKTKKLSAAKFLSIVVRGRKTQME